MHVILFILFFLIDITLFQCIRCILGFILRWIWFPKKLYKFNKVLSENELLQKRDKLIDTYPIQNFAKESDDAAKFIGMNFVANPNEETWELVTKLFSKTGTFLRKCDQHSSSNTPVFSCDMLCGVLLAIHKAMESKILLSCEKELLSKIWKKVSFYKNWFTFSHPDSADTKSFFGRGHIYRYYMVWSTADILGLLTWLYLGYKITNEKKYIILYYIFFVCHFPSLILSTSDGQSIIGPIYAFSWHQAHSKNIMFSLGYKLTKSFIFKWAMKERLKKYGDINADIFALYNTYVENITNTKYYETFLALCSSALIKGEYNLTSLTHTPMTRKYLSLIWPPEIVTRYLHFLSPEYVGNDYVWERSPLKGKTCDDIYRKTYALDFIFPVSLVLKYK